LSFTTPRQHLFGKLGIAKDALGLQKVGKGVVLREASSPAALTYKEDGAEFVRKAVREAAAAVKLPWKEANSLILRRGPYVIAAGLDESGSEGKAYVLRGRYLNLFDPDLPVLTTVTVAKDARMLLLDLNRVKAIAPKVVAASCRVRDENMDGDTLHFRADGIGDTNAIVRIAARTAPKEILVGGRPLEKVMYDFSQGVARVRFSNSVEPIAIEVQF
jgi:hypothetical protein